MLHILLLILKIAGIVLLAVLGIIILILLSVLFVPVRYRGQGSFYEKPEGIFRITWFLHLFSVRISYQEDFQILVRIFGFPLFREKEAGLEKESSADGDMFLNGEETFAEESFAGVLQEEPVLSAQELKKEEETKEEQESPRRQGSEVSGEEDQTEQSSHKPQARFLSRLACKGKNFFRKLYLLFKRLWDAVKKAEDWKERAVMFIEDEENKKTYRLIKKQAKKVLRHILPVKLKGNVTFGFDEPYTTGQVLSVAALLYPFYRDRLNICPVFDHQVLEGEISFKGRIRMGTLLSAGIRILLNKNFRKQLNQFLNRGGM